MNEPPDQTAELSAANLLSFCGMTVPKYCLTRTSCEMPRPDLKKYASASSGLAKPYRYSSRICLTTSVSVANRCHLRHERLVAFGLELVGELGTAFLHDTPVDYHVHEIRLDEVEDPLVVRDHERPHVRADELLYPVGHDSHGIDIET